MTGNGDEPIGKATPTFGAGKSNAKKLSSDFSLLELTCDNTFFFHFNSFQSYLLPTTTKIPSQAQPTVLHRHSHPHK